MMERAHEEDRQGRESHTVFARAKVRRQRHLTDIELELTHHAAERVHEHRHLDEVQLEAVRNNGTVLERRIVALRATDGR